MGTRQQAVLVFVREVKNHVNYEHRVFNSDEFLKTRAAGEQHFYKQVSRVEQAGWASFLLCSSVFKHSSEWMFFKVFIFHEVCWVF